MEKVRRDGLVAVLCSPGFGCGWYSWNSKYPELLFDPEIVQAVEDKKGLAWIEALVLRKYPGAFLGGLAEVEIVWLPQGSVFEIVEYNGAETIYFPGSRQQFIA